MKARYASLFHHMAAVAPERRGPRVLTLDGGAIRGMFTLDLIRELEANLGKPIRECFDLIVGTSTGAYLAMAIAMGKTCDEMEAEYVKVAVLFRAAAPTLTSYIKRIVQGHVIRDEGLGGLHDLLQKFFGAARLEDLPEHPKIALVTLESLKEPMPFLLRNRAPPPLSA